MKTGFIIAVKRLAIVLIFAFASLRLAADYHWPQRGDDPYPLPKGKDSGVIKARFDKASKKPLGSAADISAIKSAIIKHMNNDKSSVEEIRWLSPKLAMAIAGWYHGRLAAADYYYVVEKRKDKWKVLTYYMISIS